MEISKWHKKNLYASKDYILKGPPYSMGDVVRIRDDVGEKRKRYAGRRATVTATVVLVPTFPSITAYRLDVDDGGALWTESELEPIELAEGR